MNRSPLTICLSSTLLLAACAMSSPRSDATAADARQRRDVEMALAGYIQSLKDDSPEKLVDCFTPDGELIEPGMDTLRGHEAIHAFLVPIYQQYVVASASATSDVVEVYNDTAYQWGEYRQAAGPRGEATLALRGRFVAQWHRSDGHWRLRRMLVQPWPVVSN